MRHTRTDNKREITPIPPLTTVDQRKEEHNYAHTLPSADKARSLGTQAVLVTAHSEPDARSVERSFTFGNTCRHKVIATGYEAQ